ncbi:MAG: GNAT family N-acetyltransferase [Vampirovibrionales bacterium]|nr:GNAT family N-acetyltransferase [Vampirovibrionales bacterium]
MLQAVSLSQATVWPRLKPLWEGFCSCAISQYGWHEAPLPFNVVTTAIQQGFLQGLLLTDTAEGKDWGFLLYGIEPHGSIEVNILALQEGVEPKAALDIIFRQFLTDVAQRDDWETISYALLGKQSEYVLTAPWYGFKPVGQCIVELDLMGELTLPVLQHQHETLPPLACDFSVMSWQEFFSTRQPSEEALTALCNTIVACFSTEVDALWDPRFKTASGARLALDSMLRGDMGAFRPEWSTLLIKDNQTVGFCFVLHTDAMTANIALIGVHPSARKPEPNSFNDSSSSTVRSLGLGTQLLRHTLVRLMKGIGQGQWLLAKITATTGTDNVTSLRMYRRFGFTEQTWYPHLYLTRQTAQKSYFGKPMFSEQAPVGCCP